MGIFAKWFRVRTKVLVVKLLWVSVDSNPSQNSCVLEQDAKKHIKHKRGESHWVFRATNSSPGPNFIELLKHKILLKQKNPFLFLHMLLAKIS